jgi:hypothetical protein
MIKGFLCTIVGSLLAWVAPPASAQSDWPVMASSQNFVVVCMPEADGCAPGDGPEAFNATRPQASVIVAEAELVMRWFDSLGYPDLQLTRRDGKMLLVVGKPGRCGDDAVACHIESLSICGTLVLCRVIVLPHDKLRHGQINKGTLAHELFHGINQKANWFNKETKWLDEALASTLGNAWARKRGERTELGFVLSLDRPFHDGMEGGYEKSDYFSLLGERLGSLDGVRYLNQFFQLKDDGQKGMSYLYEKVENHKFHDLYPEFVARYNSMSSDFELEVEGLKIGDYYDKFEKRAVRIADPQSANFQDFSLTVDQFASAPVHFVTIESSKRTAEEPKNLLMVGQFEISDAKRPEDLALVFENKVGANGRYAYLFSGHDPIDGGFIRVTNAARTVQDTSAQTFTLRFRHRPVEFQLPACVAAGESAPIELEGSLAGTDNWKIRPSAGRVDGLIFHAPPSPGEVRITLEITSHITRARTERSVQTPDILEIDLGKITVVPKVCDIRMDFVEEAVTATYSSSQDYTRYDAPNGARIYIGNGRVAAFIPEEGGWISLPAGTGQMFERQMQTMVGAPSMLGTPPWAKPELHMMRRMPLVFTRWYEWGGLTDHLFPGARKSTLGARTACPTGGTGCVRITFSDQGVGSATYDEERQLVELEAEGRVVRFTYGQMNLMLPPGW